MSRKRLFVNGSKHIILIALSVLAIFPFYWMLITSLRLPKDIFKMPPAVISWPMTLDNYRNVFADGISMFRAFRNSIMVAVAVMVGTLLSSSMAGYAFSKTHFKGRDQIFGIFIATMLIPGTVCLIPMFILFSRIGWIDTHLPLIIPIVMFNAYGVFMIKQFMMGIPDSYVEAVLIDGGNHFTVYRKIAIPLCKPILVTLGLFQFIGSWNNFTGALIFISDESKYTIPLAINSFRSVYYVDWGLLMAAAVIAILPIAILYFIAQRYLVEGIMMSGIKG